MIGCLRQFTVSDSGQAWYPIYAAAVACRCRVRLRTARSSRDPDEGADDRELGAPEVCAGDMKKRNRAEYRTPDWW